MLIDMIQENIMRQGKEIIMDKELERRKRVIEQYCGVENIEVHFYPYNDKMPMAEIPGRGFVSFDMIENEIIRLRKKIERPQ